jgi:hypothetical protein
VLTYTFYAYATIVDKINQSYLENHGYAGLNITIPFILRHSGTWISKVMGW